MKQTKSEAKRTNSAQIVKLRNSPFAVQDEIVERIVGNLEPQLLLAEQSRARDKSPGDLRARDKFWRARWHFYRFTSDEHAEAQRLLKQAIEMDPDYAAGAWGLLAATHFLGAILGFSDNPANYR